MGLLTSATRNMARRIAAMINASRDPDSPPSSLRGAGFTGAASPFSTFKDCSGFAESGVSDVLTAIFVDEQVSTRRFARIVENGEQRRKLLIRYFWTAEKKWNRPGVDIFLYEGKHSILLGPWSAGLPPCREREAVSGPKRQLVTCLSADRQGEAVSGPK